MADYSLKKSEINWLTIALSHLGGDEGHLLMNIVLHAKRLDEGGVRLSHLYRLYAVNQAVESPISGALSELVDWRYVAIQEQDDPLVVPTPWGGDFADVPPVEVVA